MFGNLASWMTWMNVTWPGADEEEPPPRHVPPPGYGSGPDTSARMAHGIRWSDIVAEIERDNREQ
jgi:hypothetical protein